MLPLGYIPHATRIPRCPCEKQRSQLGRCWAGGMACSPAVGQAPTAAGGMGSAQAGSRSLRVLASRHCHPSARPRQMWIAAAGSWSGSFAHPRRRSVPPGPSINRVADCQLTLSRALSVHPRQQQPRLSGRPAVRDPPCLSRLLAERSQQPHSPARSPTGLPSPSRWIAGGGAGTAAPARWAGRTKAAVLVCALHLKRWRLLTLGGHV